MKPIFWLFYMERFDRNQTFTTSNVCRMFAFACPERPIATRTGFSMRSRDKFTTRGGKVAENSRSWRSGRMASSRERICCSNPRETIRSASSRTTYEHRDNGRYFWFTRSIKRPGVPTMRWKLWTWSAFFWCHPLCPPVMHITLRWNGARKDLATAVICSASSRVGTMTMPMGPSLSCNALGWTVSCNDTAVRESGRQKARCSSRFFRFPSGCCQSRLGQKGQVGAKQIGRVSAQKSRASRWHSEAWEEMEAIQRKEKGPVSSGRD